MRVRRRDLLRVGLVVGGAVTVGSCGGGKQSRNRRRSGDSSNELTAWSPTTLAPLSADPAVPSPVTLLVGARSRTSGRYEEELRWGFELAEKDFNAADVAGARGLEEAMRDAARAGVRLLVVDPMGEEETVARVAQKNRIPVLMLNVTDGHLPGLGDWIFLTCASDEKLGAAAVEVVKRRKPGRIAILSADSVAGRAASAGFRAALDARKLDKPIIELRVGATEAPFAKHVKSLRDLHADTVFAPLAIGMFEPLGDEIARQGLSASTFIGVDTMTERSLAHRFEGARFVTHYHADVQGSHNQTFVDAYRTKHSAAPGIVEALGYDAGTIAVSALSRAKDGSREAVRDALGATVALALTTGDATYDKRGCPDRTVVVCRFVGDAIAFDGTASAKTSTL